MKLILICCLAVITVLASGCAPDGTRSAEPAKPAPAPAPATADEPEDSDVEFFD